MVLNVKPHLLPDEFLPNPRDDSVKLNESSKLNAILDIIRNKIPINEKFLIFSQWTSFLKVIAKFLDRENIQSFQIDGSIGPEKRGSVIKDFKFSDSVRCLMAT